MGINELIHIGYGVYLAILSIIDIRIQRIPVWLVTVGGTVSAAVRIWQPEIPLIVVLGGAVVGVVFLVISKATEEALGYGDSLVILAMGIFLGFWSLLGILIGAFLLSSFFAAAFLIYRGINKRAGYPFLPFLLVSYCIWLWSGGS